MSTDVMTADRWHRVAARHVKLKAAMGAKATATNDLSGLVSVIARCNHNARRLQQIDKVMARHARRYLINVKIQNQH